MALSSLLTRYLQCPMVKEQNKRNDNETSVPLLRLKLRFIASKVRIRLACNVLFPVNTNRKHTF